MKPEVVNRFEELRRRVRLTTGARFTAAKRLGRHDKFAQWTIALLSVALTAVPLFQALNVDIAVSAGLLNAVQVLLAVLVLVFALLLSRDNHAVRADKMHRCGLELGSLERDLAGFIPTDSADKQYRSFARRYYNILAQFENHEDVDFELTLLYRRDEHYPEKPVRYWLHWIRTHVKYWAGFTSYFLVFALVVAAFWLILRPK